MCVLCTPKKLEKCVVCLASEKDAWNIEMPDLSAGNAFFNAILSFQFPTSFKNIWLVYINCIHQWVSVRLFNIFKQCDIIKSCPLLSISSHATPLPKPDSHTSTCRPASCFLPHSKENMEHSFWSVVFE